MHKEFKTYTHQEYNNYPGSSSVDPTLEAYLKEGWEILSCYTTRERNSLSYQHKSGAYINEQVDGNWLVHYLLGRKEMPGVLYG